MHPHERKKIKLVRILGRLTGGPARQACLLHQRLTPAYDTRLVIGKVCDGESDMSYLLNSDANIFKVPQMSREISFWSDFLAFWKILKLLRAERPDIVHTHTAKAGTLGRAAAWCAGVPVIIHTYHGHVFDSYFGSVKTKIFLMIERMLSRVSTRIVVISESQQLDLCGKHRVFPLEKSSLINNGFDLEAPSAQERLIARESLGLSVDNFVFVWAARMAPVKDLDLLAEVITRLAREKCRAYFLIVGDGEGRSRFESLIRGCENVKTLGWKQNMRNIWAAADAAILTSRNEGTPTALIEAMAAGLPFVSTNVGGVRDLAVEPCLRLPNEMGLEAANGFLTQRTAEALCYSIELLVQDPVGAAEMGAVGMSFVMERFGSKRLLLDLNDLYDSLLTHSYATVPLSVPDQQLR